MSTLLNHVEMPSKTKRTPQAYIPVVRWSEIGGLDRIKVGILFFRNLMVFAAVFAGNGFGAAGKR